VSDMGRAIVEEIATLASLALFVGMVAIWGTGDCSALSHRGRHQLRAPNSSMRADEVRASYSERSEEQQKRLLPDTDSSGNRLL
jgi:hypothetical protein